VSDKSKIEWTDATWQVTAGCTKVSPGCMNCYAATMAKRLRAMGMPAYQNVVTDKGQWTGWVGCLPGNLPIPLHWRKPRRIFVDSMSDLFHPSVPFEFIDRVFGVMALASWHTFQILSKRPERAAEYAATWGDGTKVDRIALAANQIDFRQGGLCERPLGHVWIGTTVENQAAADKRIPELLKIPAVVRFVSCEPLLGEIDLNRWLYSEHDRAGMDNQYLTPIGGNSRAKIGWVIAGGESGSNARPMHPNAPRSLRDQCDLAGTPFYFKQLCDERGRKLPWESVPQDLQIREFPQNVRDDS
jgi:protein gp37